MQSLCKSVLEPNDKDIYYYRGNAYFNIGIESAYELAIKDYTKLIELEKSERAYFNRASAYASLKKYKEAISDFTKSIEINPKSSENYYYRALAYYFNNNKDLSQNDFKKSCEMGFKQACNPKIGDSFNKDNNITISEK